MGTVKSYSYRNRSRRGWTGLWYVKEEGLSHIKNTAMKTILKRSGKYAHVSAIVALVESMR